MKYSPWANMGMFNTPKTRASPTEIRASIPPKTIVLIRISIPAWNVAPMAKATARRTVIPAAVLIQSKKPLKNCRQHLIALQNRGLYP